MLKNNYILVSLFLVCVFSCQAVKKENNLIRPLFGNKDNRRSQLARTYCYRIRLEELVCQSHISFMHASFFNPALIKAVRREIKARNAFIQGLAVDFLETIKK